MTEDGWAMSGWTTLQLRIEFIVLSCKSEGCGVPFALARPYVEARQHDHQYFLCPNGHRQVFPRAVEEQAAIAEAWRIQEARDEQLRKERLERVRKTAEYRRRQLPRLGNSLWRAGMRKLTDVDAYLHGRWAGVPPHNLGKRGDELLAEVFAEDAQLILEHLTTFHGRPRYDPNKHKNGVD